MHADLLGARPSMVPGWHGQAATVIQKRAAALTALIESDASQALTLAFSPDVLARLAAAFPDSAALLEAHGSWRGPVQYLIFDDPNLATARSRIRMNSPRGVLEIHFAGKEPEGLQSGDLLEVNGVGVNTTVAATGGSVQATTTAAAAACTPTGGQNVAVILAAFPGVAPPEVTPQAVYNAFFGNSGRSVDGYWREASYGKTWATGNVFGWYTLDQLYTCSQVDLMLAAAVRAADADINFQDYSRVFLIFANPGSCSFAGLSDVGCGSYSSPSDGTFTASASWLLANYFTDNDQGVKLATHEGGHALGLMHSRSRDFAADAAGALDANGVLGEYGDVFSTMGSWNLGHYAAEQKVQLGWLPSANVTTVQNAGSFTVLPAETAAAGTQALKVQRGTGNPPWLWLEYRQPVGSYDSTLPSQVFSGGLIHYHDTISGSYTDLLDYTTATSSFTDPALSAGLTWVDPYTNVSLTVDSASSSGLNVSVNYGPPPCVTAAPTVSASPANPSADTGAAVNYSLTVTNGDSEGCSASVFTLNSVQPEGWSTALSSDSLTLTPGQSASVTMTKTVPAATPPGTYPVDASAASQTGLGTATVNVTVLASPPPLSAKVASSAAVYAYRSKAVFTATVLTGSSPAAGASAGFRLVKPDGTKVAKSAKTDSTGKAVWVYRFFPNDPRGTYSLSARVTHGTQTAASSPVTFTLQ